VKESVWYVTQRGELEETQEALRECRKELEELKENGASEDVVNPLTKEAEELRLVLRKDAEPGGVGTVEGIEDMSLLQLYGKIQEVRQLSYRSQVLGSLNHMKVPLDPKGSDGITQHMGRVAVLLRIQGNNVRESLPEDIRTKLPTLDTSEAICPKFNKILRASLKYQATLQEELKGKDGEIDGLQQQLGDTDAVKQRNLAQHTAVNEALNAAYNTEYGEYPVEIAPKEKLDKILAMMNERYRKVFLERDEIRSHATELEQESSPLRELLDEILAELPGESEELPGKIKELKKSNDALKTAAKEFLESGKLVPTGVGNSGGRAMLKSGAEPVLRRPGPRRDATTKIVDQDGTLLFDLNVDLQEVLAGVSMRMSDRLHGTVGLVTYEPEQAVTIETSEGRQKLRFVSQEGNVMTVRRLATYKSATRAGPKRRVRRMTPSEDVGPEMRRALAAGDHKKLVELADGAADATTTTTRTTSLPSEALGQVFKRTRDPLGVILDEAAANKYPRTLPARCEAPLKSFGEGLQKADESVASLLRERLDHVDQSGAGYTVLVPMEGVDEGTDVAKWILKGQYSHSFGSQRKFGAAQSYETVSGTSLAISYVSGTATTIIDIDGNQWTIIHERQQQNGIFLFVRKLALPSGARPVALPTPGVDDSGTESSSESSSEDDDDDTSTMSSSSDTSSSSTSDSSSSSSVDSSKKAKCCTTATGECTPQHSLETAVQRATLVMGDAMRDEDIASGLASVIEVLGSMSRQQVGAIPKHTRKTYFTQLHATAIDSYHYSVLSVENLAKLEKLLLLSEDST
jgi:hypothetical protein